MLGILIFSPIILFDCNTKTLILEDTVYICLKTRRRFNQKVKTWHVICQSALAVAGKMAAHFCTCASCVVTFAS